MLRLIKLPGATALHNKLTYLFAGLAAIFTGFQFYILQEEGTGESISRPVAKKTSEPSGGSIEGEKSEIDISELKQRALPEFSSKVFGVSVVPQAPIKAIFISPPNPSLTSSKRILPYAYLGQYRDADGLVVFYLRHGNDLVVGKPGDNLDDAYRIDPDISQGLKLVHLPTKEEQIIPIEKIEQ